MLLDKKQREMGCSSSRRLDALSRCARGCGGAVSLNGTKDANARDSLNASARARRVVVARNASRRRVARFIRRLSSQDDHEDVGGVA